MTRRGRATRWTVVLAALLGLLVGAGPGQAAGRPGAAKPASVGKELRRLAGAVGRSTALNRGQRRSLARLATRASSAVRHRKPCPASTGLTRLRAGLVRAARRATARRRRALASLQAQTARARGRVLGTAAAGKACGGTATLDVDPSVKPRSRPLPKLGGVARPLARVVDAYGKGADFVADELIVPAASDAAAEALAKRLGGKVLSEVDLPGNAANQYLLQVDARRGDVDRLANAAQRLSKTRGTASRVSSAQGLGALALAAELAGRGTKVGVEWVGEGSSISAGFTTEDETGPAGFDLTGAGWTRDAFRWSHLAGTGPQATGVAPAWQLLESLGRLNTGSVKLAVLDMGFDPGVNGDFPPGLQPFSNVPSVNALGTMNLSSCSGGSPCPWHGTGVVDAAMGVVDNGVGGAGPAGPVARPVVVFTLYDMFTGIVALAQAAGAGATVANMSYGIPVPAVLAWTVLPFEITTTVARTAGMSLYAAAGNAAEDVDATDCALICWEETLHTPCENLGVTCVGALALNAAYPACYSNWGSDSVDVWAPGTIVTGRDPQSGQGAQAVNGTSVASPWVAGVDALGRAANPTASALQIDTALRGSARLGNQVTSTRCDGQRVEGHAARRRIDALAFVRDLLPAQVRIVAPAPGASRRRGEPIGFSGILYDDGRGPAELTWTLDGDPTPIGTGASFARSDLPYGTHTATATAVLAGGARVSDSVSFMVTNDEPQVSIQSPSPNASFSRASTIALHGASVDINEPGQRLADGQVAWLLDGSTTPFATGHDASVGPLPVGNHTIRFRGSDGIATAEASVSITVTPCAGDCPPSVAITAPANNAQFLVNGTPDGTGYYRDVAFTTSASDPEGGALTYAWKDSIRGAAPSPLSTTSANPTLRLYATGDPCSNTTHDVTVTVRDAAGNTATDTLRVRIDPGPC